MGSKFYVKKSKNDLIRAFQKYDRDNSGSISADELFSVMKEFRGNVTLAECKALIKKVDKDNSGTVNIAGRFPF